MKQNLDDIAKKYKTDKSSDYHYYTRFYEKHFEQLRDLELKVLEIGVQNGYSTKMWKEYFSNSMIYGIDIDDKTHLSEERIKIFQGNQIDKEFLTNISKEYGPFDIIIDDASHINDYNTLTFSIMFPLLKNNGIYVTEDLHTCYWPEFGNKKFTDTIIKNLVDKINANGKSGCADNNKHNNFVSKEEQKLDWLEKNVKSMHLYRSIVFIEKW
jgi:demethylmacrocin O-methyltransferase